MKKTLFLLTVLTNCAFAQVKNGEPVPDINFQTLLNAPAKQAKLEELKGKVVVIEFWATWCGSCLVAMPHLKQLQKKFPTKLRVITVTDETAERVGQYLSVKPSNLWFAIDTGSLITKLFPHQLIPHSVVISVDGRLIANTSPEFVTQKVIDSLLNGKTVHLTEKKDNTMDYEQIIKTYFFAADTIKHRFSMLPAIQGAPGLSTTWLNDSSFNGRRLTCINLELPTLYRLAHNNFPYSRTIDKTAKKKDAPTYCLDIIVPDKTALLPTLQKELSKRFDLQAKIEGQTKDVYVLKITDTEKFKNLKRNTSGKKTFYARHGEIDQQGSTMADFSDYLESYGIGNLPVIDQTGNKERFNIKFSFQPENPASLKQILAEMGLGLEKQRRVIEMLILYNRAAV